MSGRSRAGKALPGGVIPALILSAVTISAVMVLAGCSATSSTPAPRTVTRTRIGTQVPPTPEATYRPAPATSVDPLPPDAHPPKGEVEKRCPYIRTGLDQTGSGGVNLADLEGDRVYRTTVLTRLHPVGCRFYFYAPPYQAIADILPRRFRTAADAHNALVLTARRGLEQISAPNFVHGADGISYRTRFFGPDGRGDWAFAFAKGATLVVIHAQQNNTSRNTLYIGRAIAGKF